MERSKLLTIAVVVINTIIQVEDSVLSLKVSEENVLFKFE